LESVQIKALNNAITLTKCFSQPPPAGSEESKDKCESTTIDVDAAAAAIAKSDNDLAPLETQQAKAASKLSAGNDLAPIFGDHPHGSKIPLCAHWFSVFSGAHDSYQRHGRIAGPAGEHVSFHRANPQLCARTDDDGCNSKAFLLPGQRIDVGFICGQWAYVQYETQVRTKPWTTGWIETARLYAVDPLSISSTGDTLPASPSPFPSDELLSGVWRGDIAAVKRLIANGHKNVDGTGGKSAPLTIAARSGNLNMAKELLGRGANPGSHDSMLHCSAPLQGALLGGNRAIIDLIIKAGVDVNCRESAEQWTPLMSVARGSLLSEIDLIERGGPHYPIGSLSVGTQALLAAGADPNAQDAFGATALFRTAEPNNVDVADVLMHSGADVSVSDSEGITPMMQVLRWYSLSWDPTLFRMLLDNGADPNHSNPSTYDEEKGSWYRRHRSFCRPNGAHEGRGNGLLHARSTPARARS
jgi:ankyrin repeat protein